MSTAKPRICGKEPIYIPDDDCSECGNLEQRIDQLDATKLERGDIIAGTNITIVPNGERGLIINGLDINLNNYYNKSETYSRSEVDDLIADLEGVSIEVVNSLPASGTPNIIYFVNKPAPATGYDEYVWIASGNHYELIGSTDVDLSGYYTSTEVDTLLNGKVDKVTGKGLSTNDYTNADKTIVGGVTSALAGKVDKVTGKGLSANDFTNALKTKLDGIAAGAEVNVQSDWNQTNTSADDYIKNKPGNATQSANGLMSSADKTKIDGIEVGAEKNRTYTAVTGKPTSNQTPAFGETATISQITQSTTGQITATDRTIKIPNTTASSSANGLMSSADKSKLDGIEAGAEKNRTYTAVTGKPTGNQTPSFGGTATISQIAQSTTGQVSVTDRTITIPSTTATTSANGLMSSTDKTKLNDITWTKAGLLALLGYKETTITMTATDNTTATETFLVKN